MCGKGVDAAALTALARHTMRAAAHEGHPPGAVLRALNRAVLAETRPGEFLTAIFARVQRAPRRRLRARAGVRRPPAAGPARPRRARSKPLDCTGTLLGRRSTTRRRRRRGRASSPATSLLLYTDGLTEAGAPQRTLTTADVAELLAATRARTAAETAERCLARAIETGGGELRDDVAVLVGQVV